MKGFLFLLLFFSQLITFASIPDSNRDELVRLLKERKDRFGSYTESLSKKTGFFGNRSKKDILNSSNKMVEILEMDNRIMTALQRMLEYKTFEKQNLSYDVNSYEERMRNFSLLNDTLNKQNLALLEMNKTYLKKIRTQNLYFILLSVILILIVGGFGWRFYRRKII